MSLLSPIGTASALYAPPPPPPPASAAPTDSDGDHDNSPPASSGHALNVVA